MVNPPPQKAATADAGGFGGAAEGCENRGLPAQRAASGTDVTRARPEGPMPFHVPLGVRAAIVVGLLAGGFSCALAAEPPSADQRAFVDIYRELIEINTTDSTGDTLRAAEAMAARLRAGGIPAVDIKVLSSGPRKGNLVARLRGTGARRPLLLLAHLDVVEAKREDWDFDPFKLQEGDGYFRARGALDDKAMAAIFVANMIAYAGTGYRPERDI